MAGFQGFQRFGSRNYLWWFVVCAGQARVFAAVLSVLCAAVSLTSERGGLLSNCIVISVMKIDGTLIELANHHQQPGWHSQQPAGQHTPHILTTSHTLHSVRGLRCRFLNIFWQVHGRCYNCILMPSIGNVLKPLLSITEPKKYRTRKERHLKKQLFLILNTKVRRL